MMNLGIFKRKKSDLEIFTDSLREFVKMFEEWNKDQPIITTDPLCACHVREQCKEINKPFVLTEQLHRCKGCPKSLFKSNLKSNVSI